MLQHDRDTAPAPGASFRKTHPENATIYFADEPAAYWYAVEQGIVRTCRYLTNGDRQITGFFYPGEVFGLADEVYAENAEAVTRVVVRHYPGASYTARIVATVDQDSAAQRALCLARRSLFVRGHRSAISRVAAFLLEAVARLPGDGEVELAMPRADIADYLGLTVHTVSRTIAEFDRRGLIALEGPRCLRVPDRQALARVADEHFTEGELQCQP